MYFCSAYCLLLKKCLQRELTHNTHFAPYILLPTLIFSITSHKSVVKVSAHLYVDPLILMIVLWLIQNPKEGVLISSSLDFSHSERTADLMC